MRNLELELEEKLSNAESEEEMIRILNEAGYSVTAEQLKAMAETEDGELGEEALETVSGGLITGVIAKLVRKQLIKYASQIGSSGSGRSGGGRSGGGGSSRSFGMGR